MFDYPQLLYRLDQMMAMMMQSQYRVLSSKTVRPRALRRFSYKRHAIRTWSAVCLMARHSQLGKGARPYLCAKEYKNCCLG